MSSSATCSHSFIYHVEKARIEYFKTKMKERETGLMTYEEKPETRISYEEIHDYFEVSYDIYCKDCNNFLGSGSKRV